MSDRVTFITENYFLGGTPLISAGVRVKAPHTTWDFGWLSIVGLRAQGPVLNVGYKF